MELQGGKNTYTGLLAFFRIDPFLEGVSEQSALLSLIFPLTIFGLPLNLELSAFLPADSHLNIQ